LIYKGQGRKGGRRRGVGKTDRVAGRGRRTAGNESGKCCRPCKQKNHLFPCDDQNSGTNGPAYRSRNAPGQKVAVAR